MKKINGIWINAIERTITTVELASLEDIQRCLDGFMCHGWRYRNGDYLMVNDEGAINGTTTLFFDQGGRPEPLFGNGLIMGRPDHDGWHTSAKTKVEALKADVLWGGLDTTFLPVMRQRP